MSIDAWQPASLAAHAKVALNRQIARHLSDRIHAGELATGTELPSEAELATLYGVNRLTVRHALSDLARQGLVASAKGRRTIVATPPVRYRLDQTTGASLASAMAEQGLAVGHDLIVITMVPRSDAPARLHGGRRCVRFDYRRTVNGRPWSRSATWIDSALAPDAWSGARPVLDDVAATHRIDIRRASRAFAAVPATLDDGDVLDVPVGAPLLRVTGTSIDEQGRTIAAVRHHVVGDRAEYLINLEEMS